MNSEYYTTWEKYVEEHPELESIPEAEAIQNYEEAIYRFVFQLFL